MPPLCFAYYCSGHGYGHATRVSAFACHLLSLPLEARPIVYISSSAPQHVFADSIALGALYRYAEIDPIIVQPLAYCVDRQKSVDVLKLFLDRKDSILETERVWLKSIKAHAVLSDAAFIGCLAAKATGIPSILITNFTFDSVYSYLSTPLLDVSPPPHRDTLTPNSSPPHGKSFADLITDFPVALCELEPLVEQIFAGYRCADILFLLPGHIPIPAFSIYPSLPSQDWVDPSSNHLRPQVVQFLSQKPSCHQLYPSIPFPVSSSVSPRIMQRSVVPAPLLVRAPAASVYSSGGRSDFLSSIGVPCHLHDPTRTKILIVSFGGQVFRAPSRSGSRSHSRSTTPSPSPTRANGLSHISGPSSQNEINKPVSPQSYSVNSGSDIRLRDTVTPQVVAPRLATPSHIWIPGAPPVSKPLYTPPSTEFCVPELITNPPTPNGVIDFFDLSIAEDETKFDAQLLPDSSWIAIVCGVSKEQWYSQFEDNDSDLPDGFFVAPRDVYMPDLTAVGDVLLGKLGYGTVSECVDSCTPFVYVSRPLFIEEHGLRLLLGREGVGVELSRQSYEAGDWAIAVDEAWAQGEASKTKKRLNMAAGIGLNTRKIEGLDMARKVVHWTEACWESEGLRSSI